MPRFVRDKLAGDVGERAVADVLGAAGLPCESSGKSKTPGWDLKFALGGAERYVEVKYDLYEARSGNVAVEYFNPKSCKPSGLSATTSDLWAFVLADKSVWACRVADLRRHFDSNRGVVRDVPVGGDGNASIRLYDRRELFALLFTRLDGLDAGALLTVITEMLTPG